MKEWEPKYRKWCRDLIRELQWKMSINLYEIGIEWEKAPKKKDDFQKANDHCVTGEISTNHRYYSAVIKLYPNALEIWKGGDKRKCAEVIVHEMCHIITDPLYKIAYQTSNDLNHDFVEDIREQTTQHLSNILMAYLDDTKSKFLLKEK